MLRSAFEGAGLVSRLARQLCAARPEFPGHQFARSLSNEEASTSSDPSAIVERMTKLTSEKRWWASAAPDAKGLGAILNDICLHTHLRPRELPPPPRCPKSPSTHIRILHLQTGQRS